MATTALTLQQIERRLKKVYKEAKQEAENTFNDYINKLAPKMQEKQKQLAAGKITQAEYDEWFNGKMFTAKHWKELSQILAQQQTYANITAMKIVNGALPTVYGYGYKTAVESITDQATGMGFELQDAWTLHDKDTINRLVTENHQLLPTRSVNIPKDLRWNENHIQSALTQGLLHGDSIEHLAGRLQTVTDMNHRAAIRNARTMVTGAENAGRQTSYDRMTKNGVKMKKVWMATHDSRVRDAHEVMDGQEVDEDDKFTDGEGNRLEYPGDPSAPPGTVYNCRCTMHAKVIGFDFGKKGKEEEPAPTKVELNKLGETMDEKDYKEFKQLAQESENANLYAKYGDKVASIRYDKNHPHFTPGTTELLYRLDDTNGMSKFSTLAHEYNHAFDHFAGRAQGTTHKEVDLINKAFATDPRLGTLIKTTPSSSDQFLAALRSDMFALKERDMKELYKELMHTGIGATAGIQDALDGFYNTQRQFVLSYGHGAAYYNRQYRTVIDLGKERDIMQAMQEAGLGVKTKTATKETFRQYEAASEAWANIGSAVTCGGDELKAMETYLPNALEAYKRIAGGL